MIFGFNQTDCIHKIFDKIHPVWPFFEVTHSF